MLVKDVLKKFNQLVPFPISFEKIEAAGFDVKQYFKDLGEELSKCDDVGDHPRAKRVCNMLKNDGKGAK